MQAASEVLEALNAPPEETNHQEGIPVKNTSIDDLEMMGFNVARKKKGGKANAGKQ